MIKPKKKIEPLVKKESDMTKLQDLRTRTNLDSHRISPAKGNQLGLF